MVKAPSRDVAGTISQDNLVHLKVQFEISARLFTGKNVWGQEEGKNAAMNKIRWKLNKKG